MEKPLPRHSSTTCPASGGPGLRTSSMAAPVPLTGGVPSQVAVTVSEMD